MLDLNSSDDRATVNLELYCVGLDHKTAPLTVRERCAIAPEKMVRVLDRLRRSTEHSVVLATCGRIEIYFTSSESRTEPHRIFADAIGVAFPEIRCCVRVLRHDEVVRHLLRVAAGLESQIMGEDHIQAQVRRAFHAAQEAGTCGPVLSALGRAAIHAGKRVRHETAINSIPLSFARLAVQEFFRSQDGPALGHVVIVGSGMMARDVARELRAARMNLRLSIAGRDPARAELLAADVRADAFGLNALPTILQDADAVFACTSSPRFIITSSTLGDRSRPIYLFDLGLPRNIEPLISERRGVSLRHLDDLAPATTGRSRAVAEACAIVQQEGERFLRWHQARQKALILAAHGSQHEPATAALVRDHARRIERMRLFDEVAVAFHQGEPDFSEVLDQLRATEITVVPLMTSRGYYSEIVLPRRLAENRRYGAVSLRQTAPVGLHPRLADLVMQRVTTLLRENQLDPRETDLLIVGHGTPRHARSRCATEELAARLRSMRVLAGVAEAFLDEQPSIAQAFAGRRTENVIVVPFLIGLGAHVNSDIPAQLGMIAPDPLRLPLRQWIGRKLVICDAAVGTYPGLTDLIVELACHRSVNITGSGNKSGKSLRLGTRGSLLARWQANYVAQLLQARGVDVEIVLMSTIGDREQDVAVADLPGPAPFTDDIAQALLEGRIDLAVHSLKDLPITSAAGLTLAAFLPRGQVTESLVSRDNLRLHELPSGAMVGTSSPRRAAQLLALRPDLRPTSLRGPVDERVRLVRAGELDAAILATAGLQRLGLLHEVSQTFSLDEFLPAPGQGAVAVQVRDDDMGVRETCAGLDDALTRLAVTTELEFLRPFESDRKWFAAACAEANGHIDLRARLISSHGRSVVEVSAGGHDPRSVAQTAIELAWQQIRCFDPDHCTHLVATAAERG